MAGALHDILRPQHPPRGGGSSRSHCLVCYKVHLRGAWWPFWCCIPSGWHICGLGLWEPSQRPRLAWFTSVLTASAGESSSPA
jgi:hypothetical protein